MSIENPRIGTLANGERIIHRYDDHEPFCAELEGTDPDLEDYNDE